MYNCCNKANIKSFPSASKFKLAWKPFSIMKIPTVLYLDYCSVFKLLLIAHIRMISIINVKLNKIWKKVRKKYGNNIKKY